MKRSGLLTFAIVLILLDIYFYQGIKTIIAPLSISTQNWVYIGYIIYLIVTASIFLAFYFQSALKYKWVTKGLVPAWFMQYIVKLFGTFFLLLNDIYRVIHWVIYKAAYIGNYTLLQHPYLPRSVMVSKVGILATVVPLVTLSYGIIVGAHDYRVRRVRIRLPKLPAAFHGLKIGQLSDIHSGSFFNKKAMMRGIDMLLQEKADVIFFTGDLVNDRAEELKDYMPIFSKIKAPLGVYSVLGNHDYGEYIAWPSMAAKQQNLKDLCQAHALLGWNLLMNEHKILTIGADQLAILGVENWGTRFTKYGNLAQAYQGVENMPVKLLLSHDPSHWDAQIRPQFKDIDITFSGHTHGFQFGIEIGSFKWSPVQYQYKQWAGLYQEDNQYLYVNRGFGYLGYPGRIGMRPEITIIELEKG